MKCGTIIHSAKEARQQKSSRGGGWRQRGRGGWIKFENEGGGGVGKIGESS